MNDTGIRPEVIEEIRNLAQKYDIEKVILFGSRARGDYKERSCLDTVELCFTRKNAPPWTAGQGVMRHGNRHLGHL